MKTVNNSHDYFDQLAQTYTATQRLSPSCAVSIVKSILNQIPSNRCSSTIDIGCGDAYLSSLLLKRSKLSQCILLDISRAMLERARQRVSSLQIEDRVLFVRANAHAVPLRSSSTAVVLMAFVLHLLSDPTLALNVTRRILMPEGHFFMLTYDPDDLASHIYHRYFPGYQGIDLQRFTPMPQLVQLVRECGFVNISYSKYSYQVQFESVQDVIHIVKDKPFSAFVSYEDKAFTEGLREFECNLREHFGQGKVFYESRVTLLSARS